ncbi:MAG: DNA-3-methyladenine glycosylase [Proteobacteria bacterium]|nr:DNA-3-methyladenine glycosylase [Pseudomonadota bacterium]
MEVGTEFFARNTLEVAQELLGKRIAYRDCVGVIVETEAYRDDPASHGVRRSEKARLLKETYGRIYVYSIYGMHFCLNFTTERQGVGAVLIRAVEPVRGVEIMRQRRKTKDLYRLTNGPGKLCQAFDIGRELLGKGVGDEFKVLRGAAPRRIERARRIGISKAKDLDWRFFIPENPFVSR